MSSPSIMPTYKRLDVCFTHGEGCWLYDTAGRRYLDALSGIAVCGLGHSHPAVTQAITSQAGKLLHTSNLYGIGPQQELAERITRLAGMDSVFFGNSGAEANEAAIKIARLYGHQKGIDKPSIIVMEGAFHGRTLATLSATGSRKVQAGFEPLVSGFVRARYGDLPEIAAIARNNPRIVAVLVEPVQGEAGIRIAPPGYLQGLREICDAHGWLLMLDEVQTGNGRTGRMFAWQHEGAAPDVLTTAKGLGNGVPIGACLARGKAASVFGPGNHGSTFGGNPLACAAANAVLQTIEDEHLCEHAARMGDLLVQQLRERLAGVPGVREVRGKGLMVGIELQAPGSGLVEAALAEGLLINVTADNVIRLLPPLVISEAEVTQITDILVRLLAARAA
jgi:acetylornithine aminotransferase